MIYQLLALLVISTPDWERTAGRDDPVAGVVCQIKVVSDKVPDVSSIEAWKRSFIRTGMTDQEKALAAWRSTVMFQHQDNPPNEYLQNEVVVQDPIKLFNVYGYSFCSVAACDVEALARASGLRARGWAINGHSVPEVYWDGAWHLLDASLINYFPNSSGSIAGVEEILAAVKDWYAKSPGYKGDDTKLRAFHSADGWKGWTKGPALLTLCPFYDASGWWPARTHGWYATMQEYDGTCGKDAQPYLYEYGYSQGYQVNICLRPGERLTRNWSHKGLHVNYKDGDAPDCLNMKTGADFLVYTPKYGDLAPGRVGNGVLEYDVPVADGTYRAGALTVENLQDEAVRVKDAARSGVLVLRMPSSYVYLTGTVKFITAVGPNGSVAVSYSDNHGLDWKEVARATSSGEHCLDLSPLVLRRYDYRLKFECRGKNTGLDALKIVHDIQHSQRPLPALGQGANTITFSSGTPEATVTVEGSTDLANKGKQLLYTDFHPQVSGFERNLFIDAGGKGTLTLPVASPGDLVRLRFGAHYRARDEQDGLDYQVSLDCGKTWKTVDRAAGPTPGDCKYTVFTDIPAGTR